MAERPNASHPHRGGGGTTVQLSIEKIYVKDLSLENPGAPQSFTAPTHRRSRSDCARAASRSSPTSTNAC